MKIQMQKKTIFIRSYLFAFVSPAASILVSSGSAIFLTTSLLYFQFAVNRARYEGDNPMELLYVCLDA